MGGGSIVVGVCVGVTGLLLRAMVLSIADESARERNAARLTWLAVLSLIAGVLAPFLPYLATSLALHRLGRDRDLVPEIDFSGPFVFGAIGCYVLSEVVRTRRGQG